MTIRTMREGETDAVARLIHRSTNAWYQQRLGKVVFAGGPEDCRVFPQVYEALDPGCCLVAEIDGELAGSCFYHPRETHVALGIMNAAAEHAGKGVAGALLAAVIERAGEWPLRLVSSAMNLDSYSLYTRAGFTPVAVYQDMVMPAGGAGPEPLLAGALRPAVAADVGTMADLEHGLTGIRREKDCGFFIHNAAGIWRTWIHEDASGQVDGWLASVDHPGCRMLGPGVAVDEPTALALVVRQLSLPRGGPPIVLVPAAASGLVAELYRRGGRNVELHLAQVRGHWQPPRGVVFPTFLPESG
jgi:GNAT superfamily N-acetyltransferase